MLKTNFLPISCDEQNKEVSIKERLNREFYDNYSSAQSDPYIRELLKEIEFLKRENIRLSSYYLDTIEQEEVNRVNLSNNQRLTEVEQENGYLCREINSIHHQLDGLMSKHGICDRYANHHSKTEITPASKKIENIDDFICSLRKEQIYENNLNNDIYLSKNMVNKLTSPTCLSRNNLHDNFNNKRNSENIVLTESDEMRNSRNSFAAAPLKGSLGFRSSYYNMGRTAYRGIY